MTRILKNFDQKNGRLTIGGFDVTDAVKKLGSPFYIYDASIMRRQYKAVKAGLAQASAHIHYSIKANPNKAVAAVFARMGAGVEVASAQELKVALAAGFAPSKIIFAGPGKSDDELKLAIDKKIGLINVESAVEFDRIVAIAEKKKNQKVAIAFRVNLDIDIETRQGKIMLGGAQKFGIDEEALLPLVKKAIAHPSIDFAGFHCFAGTQITDTRALSTVYRSFAKWAKNFAAKNNIAIKSLNFGGGMGIPFIDTDSELSVNSLGKTLCAIRKDLQNSPEFKRVKFLVEPGRYLVGPSGVYVTRITDIKSSAGSCFIITDGGIHHALIPIVMNKNYPTHLINKLDKPRRTTCTVVGPLCSSADQLSRPVKIPKPEIGDLLGIFNSGAYGYTAGMLYFLSHPTPAEALVDNKKLYLIRASKNPDHGVMQKLSI